MKPLIRVCGVLSICMCLLPGTFALEDHVAQGPEISDIRAGPPCNDPFLPCEEEFECLTKAKVITIPDGFALNTCQLQGQFHYNFTLLNHHGKACEILAYYQMWTGNTYIQNDTCKTWHKQQYHVVDHVAVAKRQMDQNCTTEFDDLVKAGTITVLEGFSLNTCTVDSQFRYTFHLQNEDQVTCEIDAMYQLWTGHVYITNDTCKPIVDECKQELDLLVQKGAVHIPNTFTLKTALCKTLGLSTDYYFTFQTNDQTICDIHAHYQPWFQTAIVMSDTCSPHVARGGHATGRRTMPETNEDPICPSCRDALEECLKEKLFTVPKGRELKAAQYKWEMGMTFYFMFANNTFTSACEIVVHNQPWMLGYVVRSNTCPQHVATREERARSRRQEQNCTNVFDELVKNGAIKLLEGFSLSTCNVDSQFRYNFYLQNEDQVSCEIDARYQLWTGQVIITRDTCMPIIKECKQELDVLVQKGAVHIPNTFTLKTALCKTLMMATDYYYTFQTNDQTVCDIHARFQPWMSTVMVGSDTCSPHVARGGHVTGRRAVPETTDDPICPSCREALAECLNETLFTIPKGFELKAAQYKWEMGTTYYFTFANNTFTSVCEIVVHNQLWMLGYVVRSNTCPQHVATRAESMRTRRQDQNCTKVFDELVKNGAIKLLEGFSLSTCKFWNSMNYIFYLDNEYNIGCEIDAVYQFWTGQVDVTYDSCIPIYPKCKEELEALANASQVHVPESYRLKTAYCKDEGMSSDYYFSFQNQHGATCRIYARYQPWFINVTVMSDHRSCLIRAICRIYARYQPWFINVTVMSDTCSPHVPRGSGQVTGRRAIPASNDDPICQYCREALAECLKEKLFTIPTGFQLVAANNTWEMGQTYNFTFGNKTGITCEISVHNQLWTIGYQVSKNTCTAQKHAHVIKSNVRQL